MVAITEVSGTSETSAPAQNPLRHLLSSRELAIALGISTKTLERWTGRRMIPFLRLSSRLIKYDLARVKTALDKYEVREVGARR